MTGVASLLLLALACPKVPDQCFATGPTGPAWDDAQGGGTAVRVAASADDQKRVEELFLRQDQAIVGHDLDTARKDFDESFSSSDYRCDSSDQLLERWQKFLDDHEDSGLSTKLLHAERVGEWIVADVHRKFTGLREGDEKPTTDDSIETHVLHDAGGRLLITAAYENEISKAPRIDRERRSYDARQDLCFQLRSLPEPFVPIPRRGPGAALDELLLVDPADDATLGMAVYDPTVDEPLLDLIWRDCADPEARWLLEPKKFDRLPAGITTAFEAEVECSGTMGPNGKRSKPACERAIYLSPDGRIVFALWLRSAPESFARVKRKVDELARSLQLTDVGPRMPYLSALLAKNRRWDTLKNGVFRPESATVELPIPVGMVATPLLGDHVLRLRLRSLDDPKSSLIVRFFPGGEDRFPADKILERTVERMEAFACAEGAGGASHRTDGTTTVLGSTGDWRKIEIVCRDGSRRNYQIVAFESGDCHVQVQVLPGSGNVDKQADALTKVLESLRVRSADATTVPTASKGAPEPQRHK
jgi:hypothetical protein